MTRINKTELRDFFKSRSEIPKEVINQHFLLSVENDDDLLELFLILGANPNSSECKAMETMVERQNLKAIKLLHSYGGNLDVDLSKAIEYGNIELIKYMFENGVEVREHYLHTAIVAKKYDMMHLIINHSNLDITDYEMRTAAWTSVEAIKVLLEYTGDFPEKTFYNEDGNIWGEIKSLNAEVLSFVIESIETKPWLFSKIFSLSRSRSSSLDKFFVYMNMALESACYRADYPKIKVTVEYLEKKKELHKYPRTISRDAYVKLCYYENSIQKLNEIMKYLKKHEILEKELIRNIYRYASMETLEIFDIQKNTKCLQDVIMAQNTKLVKELLEIITPTEEEVELAYEQVIMEGNEDCRKIYEMLVKKQR